MNVVRRLVSVALSLAVAVPLFAEPDWVKRSNDITNILLITQAKMQPEGASFLGVDGYDNDVSQLPPDVNAKNIAALQEARAKIEARRKGESRSGGAAGHRHPRSRDRRQHPGPRLSEKYDVQYLDLPQLMFNATRSLLDERVEKERRGAALVRLRKYTGLEKGYTPLTQQAMAFTRASLKNPKLRGPFKDDLEKNLANTDRYLDGIGAALQEVRDRRLRGAVRGAAQADRGVRRVPARRKCCRARAPTSACPPEIYAFSSSSAAWTCRSTS